LFERFDFNPDQCFNVFNDKIKVLLERHMLTVKLTKRQLRSKLKPWITPGILKSISNRNFYHRKFIKAKNPEDKERFSNLFKSYRNLIVTLCRQSKLNHFTRYFNHHSNNMQKVWSGVRDIISVRSNCSSTPISLFMRGSVISKSETVANCFNDFFTSIAGEITSKLPPSRNHFSGFLKNPYQSSLKLTPTTTEEVLLK